MVHFDVSSYESWDFFIVIKLKKLSETIEKNQKKGHYSIIG